MISIFRLILLAILIFSILPISAASDQNLDIAEAVFLYQFKRNASMQQSQAKVYCISLFKKDPDEQFMKRFKYHQPPVKKLSKCTTKGMQVTDKDTGKSGLIFNVSKIRIKEGDSAEVDGGYYETGLSASGNTYFVKRSKGKWIVEKDTMHWIS